LWIVCSNPFGYPHRFFLISREFEVGMSLKVGDLWVAMDVSVMRISRLKQLATEGHIVQN
jgi:hypothetical protein